jgi:hypothetical protein
MQRRVDYADYLLDHYGECALGAPRCVCLKPTKPWLGRLCPQWRPWGARTLDELQARLMQRRVG